MISNYYHEWQTNRVNFILEHVGPEYFNGKRVLELAPCNGYIGYRFSELGAIVHYIEGREENVERIKRDFPMNTVEQADLDTPDWLWGRWDVIINFGLYYHLEKHHREHLINCINNCDMMFFESVIFDSNSETIFYRSEQGFDQSLTNMGGTPSTSFIENIFKEQRVEFTKHSSSKLNGDGHVYDWVETNSSMWHPTRRRFWVVNTHHGEV